MLSASLKSMPFSSAYKSAEFLRPVRKTKLCSRTGRLGRLISEPFFLLTQKNQVPPV
jgi:hypothetical protein